jgi:hypothetical protein
VVKTLDTFEFLAIPSSNKALVLDLARCEFIEREEIEAKNERRLMRFQKMLSRFELLTIDELCLVPLSRTGAELLFEVFSRRYERSSTLVTSNLPFNEWTEAFGSERLTGALLDRLTLSRPNPGDERGKLPLERQQAAPPREATLLTLARLRRRFAGLAPATT